METFSALLAICAENHWSPMNSRHKGQLRGALMHSLICARINGWVNNREARDLRRHRGHYDAIVMAQSLGCAVNDSFLSYEDEIWAFFVNSVAELCVTLFMFSISTYKIRRLISPEHIRNNVHLHIFKWLLHSWTLFFSNFIVYAILLRFFILE